MDDNSLSNVKYDLSNSSDSSIILNKINLFTASSATNYDVITNTSSTSDEYYIDEDYLNELRVYVFPDAYEWVMLTFYAIVFIVGLIGNILVCFAVGVNAHMRTVTNLFIVNLATADLLVLILCLIPTALEDATETWYIGGIGCKIVKYCQAVSVSVSVLTLTAISVERFFAICKPMKFKGTLSRARIIIGSIWTISLLLFIPELIFLDIAFFLPRYTILLTSCQTTADYNSQLAYQVFQLISLYLLPFCLMGYTYTRIAIVLQSNTIPTEPSMYKDHRSTTGDRKPVKSTAENTVLARKKVAKMLIAVVIMFGLCYLPVHMLNVVRYAKVAVPIRFALLAHWLCYFNSAINPVIYNFMSEKFRRAFKQAISCRPSNSSSSATSRMYQTKETHWNGRASAPAHV